MEPNSHIANIKLNNNFKNKIKESDFMKIKATLLALSTLFSLNYANATMPKISDTITELNTTKFEMLSDDSIRIHNGVYFISQEKIEMIVSMTTEACQLNSSDNYFSYLQRMSQLTKNPQFWTGKLLSNNATKLIKKFNLSSYPSCVRIANHLLASGNLNLFLNKQYSNYEFAVFVIKVLRNEMPTEQSNEQESYARRIAQQITEMTLQLQNDNPVSTDPVWIVLPLGGIKGME